MEKVLQSIQSHAERLRNNRENFKHSEWRFDIERELKLIASNSYLSQRGNIARALFFRSKISFLLLQKSFTLINIILTRCDLQEIKKANTTNCAGRVSFVDSLCIVSVKFFAYSKV